MQKGLLPALFAIIRDASPHAKGGTLFLDEIGDLPLSIQAKLLRVLQEKVYERLGDLETRKANVRIIAATNIDLESAIKAGRFREDLFYRLDVVEIVIPPLRDRREDIPPIAEALLAFFARQNHRQILGFSEEALGSPQKLRMAWQCEGASQRNRTGGAFMQRGPRGGPSFSAQAQAFGAPARPGRPGNHGRTREDPYPARAGFE